MESDATCSVYLSLEKGRKTCVQATSKLLHLSHKERELYFCRGSHLVRFIVEQYGKQGRRAKNGKKKESESGEQ